MMRRTVSLMLILTMMFSLAACSHLAASKRQGEKPDSASAQSDEVQERVEDTAEQSGKQRNMVQDTNQETEGQGKEQQETGIETEASESVLAGEQEAGMDTKTLVVYFSCTGTTKPLAEYAAEILGADLYEIVAAEPYTEADLAYYTGGRADQEQDDPNARPGISGNVENMDGYDTILIGYPIWHGQAPRIISTFLESYDFSEKTIVPFCTSHSSGIGSSAVNLHTLCPDSVEWVEGKRFEVGTSRDAMEEWIQSIGIQ